VYVIKLIGIPSPSLSLNCLFDPLILFLWTMCFKHSVELNVLNISFKSQICDFSKLVT
jgi:hypothetical protein